MITTGKIIALAYPDTFVTMSNEWQCKVLPFLGLGTKDYIKAGHAALILIENETGKANYYDFGRYVTPFGKGRVRSVTTDAELKIPFVAHFYEDGLLKNLDEFLLWLDKNSYKTHGEGRLLASVCNLIDYKKALSYILSLQKRGSIPYGAFVKKGSNCSRFVTDTILASTQDKTIIKRLNHNKKFTPSTVGNVEKAAASKVFEVCNGKISVFKGSALRENLKNYFHRKNKKREEDIKEDFLRLNIPSEAQLLKGIGSSAWFKIEQVNLSKNYFRVKRFNDLGQLDFDGVYTANTNFDISRPYQFTYDSHCEFCHVLQKNKKIKLNFIVSYATFNLKQEEHLI